MKKSYLKKRCLRGRLPTKKTDSELTEHGITTIFENYLPPKTGG